VNLPIDIESLENAAEILRAMGHPLRIAICHMLEGNKKMSVTEIYETLAIEQAIASHHLRILKDRKVLNAQRDGKNTFYSLRSADVTSLLHALEKLA
jgi:DNA-binding transcriptional ArsR family regulator